MDDFRRFFLRGLGALLPTLITLWLLVKGWDFLWDSLGRHLIWAIKWVWLTLGDYNIAYQPAAHIGRYWSEDNLRTRVVGVVLAVVLVYMIGILVGNYFGRYLWRLLEVGVKRIPLVRAIYPAVKQVTDFLLADKHQAIKANRVVACRPHSNGIWSIGLVTGQGLATLSDLAKQPMITVFVPSSPTAFSGYVMVVPCDQVVPLPLTVEEAMRLLVSGGVIAPPEHPAAEAQAAHDPVGVLDDSGCGEPAVGHRAE